MTLKWSQQRWHLILFYFKVVLGSRGLKVCNSWIGASWAACCEQNWLGMCGLS